MSKIKILIIHNDSIVSQDIKRSLHSAGYSITSTVSTGKEALKKMAENKPDLVFLDMDLKSKQDGIETVRQTRDRYHIPIIYVSTCSNEKLREEIKKTESFSCIRMPIDEKELRYNIEAILHQYAQEKRLKRALGESEQRYRQLIDCMNEGIIVHDENGIITCVNRKFLEMSGYTHYEVLGHLSAELLNEANIEIFEKQRTSPEKGIPDTCEIEWQRKDGQKILLRCTSALIHDDEGCFKGRITVLTDLTERRQVEKKLERSREELRNLSLHLHSVREKESKRISREIHDELGQALTALKMELSWLAHKLPDSPEGQERFHERIKSMSRLIDDTIRDVQRIASELRPGILDDLGLVPAIEWQAQDFQNRTKIECETDLDSNGLDLEPEFSTAIFRIFQGALTNVARHAEATKVKISLKKMNGNLEMLISDNGKGIMDSDIISPASLGLMVMRERLRPFDGILRLHGIPNRGTTLAVTLPIDKCQAKKDQWS